MTWSRSLLPLGLLAVFASTVLAQRGPGFGPGRSNFPEVGSLLPDVPIYDDQGDRFSTKSLRGHYSVLVFGCLT